MALNTYEQIMEYLKESTKVVVALDKKVSPDILGAAYALQHLLTFFEKQYYITSEEAPKNSYFLTNDLKLNIGFKQARRLVIKLDIKEQGLEKFYYTTDQDKRNLEMYIVPKSGFFNPDDVRVNQGEFEYDLIITLGASDLNSLGNIYQQNTAFFHETPIINIDHKASNEKFGEVNLVESVKSSVCEVMFDFIQHNFHDIIKPQVATGLMAGILEKTQSFRVPTLSPHTLEVSSKLLEYKADRELVVRELFYNKSLPMVKLWGRVLARLKENKEKNLYWSLINTEDYIRAGASPKIIDKVFEEVLSYLSKDATILLFSEYNDSVLVLVYEGNPSVNIKDILGSYKLVNTDYGMQFKLWERDLLEVEEEVMQLF